jgi:hypothetical protein
MLREELEPARHRTGRHVGTGQEREDECDQGEPLGRLDAAREQADDDENEREHDPVEETQAQRGQPVEPGPAQPESEQEAEGGSGDDRQAFVVESASVRASTREYRGTGRESSRSVNPCARSSATATATATPPPVNRTIVAT